MKLALCPRHRGSVVSGSTVHRADTYGAVAMTLMIGRTTRTSQRTLR